MTIRTIWYKIKRKMQREKLWLKRYQIVKKEYVEYKKKNKNFYILIGTPLHGNLGDHAITLAEYQLIKDLETKEELLEIPSFLMQSHPFFLKRVVGQRKILIHGGGFLGSLWMNEENMVRNVIQTFPNNQIIIFPQTAYFEDSDEGKRIYKKSKEIYSSHKNLHICTREKVSYSLVSKMIKTENVHLYPDMVPYLNFDTNNIKEKSGVLLCLRKDKEKVLTKEQEEKMEKVLKQFFGNNILSTDTVVSYDISKDKRQEEVRKKIEEFAKAQLVITDRLHGMVFAALAETPCITLSNCNYKVEGVYEWIKHNSYIRFLQGTEDIEQTIKELLEIKEIKYDKSILQNQYTALKNMIQNTIK